MTARNTGATVLTKKTCKQITDLVLNYLNDNLPAAVKRAFDRHLKICPDCVAFLNTYRKTVAVMKTVRAEDMPENVRKNILGFLDSRARKKPTGV